MSKKKLFRFSKGVTLLCLAVNVALTVTFAVLLWRGVMLDGMVVAAMYAPTSIELGYNMMISIAEKKGQKNGNSEDHC